LLENLHSITGKVRPSRTSTSTGFKHCSLPGYTTATPDTLQRRFLETPGQIITTADTITVRLNRRAYSPVLRQADLPDTPVPWWDNRTLHYEFA